MTNSSRSNSSGYLAPREWSSSIHWDCNLRALERRARDEGNPPVSTRVTYSRRHNNVALFLIWNILSPLRPSNLSSSALKLATKSFSWPLAASRNFCKKTPPPHHRHCSNWKMTRSLGRDNWWDVLPVTVLILRTYLSGGLLDHKLLA